MAVIDTALDASRVVAPRRSPRFDAAALIQPSWPARAADVAAAVPPQPARFDATGLLTVWAALLILVPGRWVVPSFGAAGRPAALFALAMFALWLVARLLPGVVTDRTPLRWLVLANAIVVLIGYVLAQGRGLSSAEASSADRAIIDLVSTCGVLLVASEGVPSLDRAVQLLKRIVAMVAFVSVIGLVQFLTRIDPYAHVRIPGLVLNREISDLTSRGAANFVRVKGSMLHPIEFAVVMGMTLPLAIHLGLHERRPVARIGWLVAAGSIGVASLLAVSRSAVVTGAAAAIVLVLGWSPRTRLKMLALVAPLVVVVQAGFPGLLGTLRSLFQNWDSDSSIRGRTDDYEIVAAFVTDRPWFGRGVGTFLPSEYILLDNAYLGRIVATGVVGLASLLALQLATIWRARRLARTHRHRSLRHLGVALAALFAGAAVASGTFDFWGFGTASGLLLAAMGLVFAVTSRHCLGPDPGAAPPDTLHPRLQPGTVRTPVLIRLDQWVRGGAPPAATQPAETSPAMTSVANLAPGIPGGDTLQRRN